MRNEYVSQSSGMPNRALEIYLYRGKSKRLSQYSEVAADCGTDWGMGMD